MLSDYSIEPHELTTHRLSNLQGLKMEVTNLGGKIMSLKVRDKDGKLTDVVLGYDQAADYLQGNPFFGALIGRYANRIAHGKFTLEGKDYTLPVNNGLHVLHGGKEGFHNVLWNVQPLDSAEGEALELSYLSRDGACGFPGTMTVKVIYTLTSHNALSIRYEAETDKTTLINLTHHSFFNLAGEGSGDILGHRMAIFGNYFTPVTHGLIPTGELRSVINTPFDFRQPRMIGEQIDQKEEQLFLGRGYDHNWALNKTAGLLSRAALVEEPVSGLKMEVWTTEPGLQFYSGNFLDGTDIGKGLKKYAYRSAFCLEAQHFPDSPHHSHFPSTVLDPGQTYRQHTVYKFLIPG